MASCVQRQPALSEINKWIQGQGRQHWARISDLTQIGSNTTGSTPYVTLDPTTNEVWVYFQGTDNKLWKVRNDAAGRGLLHIGGNCTRSTLTSPRTGRLKRGAWPSGPSFTLAPAGSACTNFFWVHKCRRTQSAPSSYSVGTASGGWLKVIALRFAA